MTSRSRSLSGRDSPLAREPKRTTSASGAAALSLRPASSIRASSVIAIAAIVVAARDVANHRKRNPGPCPRLSRRIHKTGERDGGGGRCDDATGIRLECKYQLRAVVPLERGCRPAFRDRQPVGTKT